MRNTAPFFGAFLALPVLLSCAPAASQENSGTEMRQYAIPDTQILSLETASNGIDYELYVHVPSACREEGRRCPAIYMLDAEYSFALSAQIVTHLADRNRIGPVISVAIAYPDKSGYRLNRTRDYTPWFVPGDGYGPEYQKYSGGGPAFLKVVEEEIIPAVEAGFPVEKGRRTLVGHSYGGLFATHVWTKRPDIFDNYVIVSPSLWYADQRPLREVAEACAANRADGENGRPARLLLAVGSLEEQPGRGRGMVTNLRQMRDMLANCPGRDVAARYLPVEGETHASIFPTALSNGIRWLFHPEE